MSLTFTASFQAPTAHVVTCGCDAATALAVRYASYEAACTALPAPGTPAGRALEGCEMPDICPDYPLHVQGVDEGGDAPEVDLNDLNAVALLDLLGLPRGEDLAGELVASGRAVWPDEDQAAPEEHGPAIPIPAVDAYGQLPAGDFLGRVLIALALTPQDAGREGYWTGRHFRGGRTAGHLQLRLHELHALALWCAEHGREVAWS
ncbi:hypothetical protein [Streptomyces nanshensis]|uniref:hypothetical protein n=1 Tax=Streptomyces nanshensis TaxID=518642 RepID=UPI00085BED94|nr:hypothetical protein [Streptomyces nanshensis]